MSHYSTIPLPAPKFLAIPGVIERAAQPHNPATGAPYRYSLTYGVRYKVPPLTVLADDITVMAGFAVAILTGPKNVFASAEEMAAHPDFQWEVHDYCRYEADEALSVRISATVLTANLLQINLLSGALAQGDYMAEFPELDIRAVFDSREKPIRAKSWRHPIPAIVSMHVYRPHGRARLFIEHTPNLQHPIVKLDPSEEITFITTMQMLCLWTFKDHAAE